MTRDVWVVEMLDDDGDTCGEVFLNPETLGSFVRVNAQDAATFRIVKTSSDSIASQACDDGFPESEN